MKATKLDERFFDSTRGRIVTLLRGATGTVDELARALKLTDNGVRAHLLTLERDGLVKQSGVRRGLRKPHYTYTLTPEAEFLFPKAYDSLLNQLITVLKGRLAPEALEEVLREVGRTMAQQTSGQGGGDLQDRLQRTLKVLESLGGSAEIRQQDDKFVIQSGGCPLAAAVAEHPEVCRLVEALVAEVVGVPAYERCERESSPRCSFEIRSFSD